MKKIYIHIIHILLFVAITFFYCWPIIEGEVVDSGDFKQFKGMSQEIEEYRTDTGEEALWTNRMFGGMPTFHMGVKYPNNILLTIDQIFQLGFPRPIGMIFICFLGFYILLLTLKLDLKIAFLGALAFGLSSYLYIIIAAGHNTKIHAIAYMAPTIAAMIYCYRDKRLLGFFLTFLFLGLQIRANHYQITYYLLFLLFGFWLYEIICSVNKKELKNFLKNTVVFSLGCLFAILINIPSLWSTYDYSKYSTRGGSEINLEEKNHNGLDYDYVTEYSYGKLETFNLMIPNLYGGSSQSSELSEKSSYYKTLNSLKKDGFQLNPDEIIQNTQMYWGGQPFTSGPVYIGSIVVFLFFLGLFIMNEKGIQIFSKSYILGWILFGLILLSIFLSWGYNFWLAEYFFHYFPMYSKFRVVSMMLVIVEIAIPILAVIGLTKFLDINFSSKKVNKRKGIYLLSSFFIFIFICGCVFFMLSNSSLTSIREKENLQTFKDDIVELEKYSNFYELKLDDAYKQSMNNFTHIRILGIYRSLALPYQIQDLNYQIIQQKNQIEIQEDLSLASVNDRWSLFTKDLGRSVIFVFLSVIILSLFLMQRLNRNIVIYLIAGLILVDMWFVNKRYLNSNNFSKAQDVLESPFQANKSDKKIMQDKSHYRVYDGGGARTSYFHNNILGYHAAKLSRYNDVLNKHFPDNKNVFDMLNVKYLGSEIRYSALGNAWFISNVKYVNTAQEEFNYLSDLNFDPKSTIIVNNKDSLNISQSNYFSNNDQIDLINYSPNELVYKSQSENKQLAVFSEIYYPKGWNAYIDGEKVPYFCANYILRALEVPKGERTITFKFEPNSFYVGNNIALASSIIFILTFISLFFPYFRRKFRLLKK